MHLDDREIRELAEFLARRFDPDLMPTPRDTAADWVASLHDAQRQGRLAQLLRRAAATAPDDENLQTATRIVAPRAQPWAALAGAGLALAAATAIGAFTLLVGDEAIETPADAPLLAAVAVPEAPAIPPTALQPQSVAPVDGPATAPPSLQPQSVAPAAVASLGDCVGRPDEQIGWWYAGTQRPGQAGDVIELAAGVNVRAYPPSASNHFDSRGPVRCVLPEGARIRLTADALSVPKDSWWVPLYGGDLAYVSDAVADASRSRR